MKKQCALCGKVFISNTTDDEATKEFIGRFGRLPTEGEKSVVLCDKCYHEALKQIQPMLN